MDEYYTGGTCIWLVFLCFFKLWINSSVIGMITRLRWYQSEERLYKVNRTGPSTVPCGTLYREHSPVSWGNGNLFCRYDSKLCSTVPLILTKCSNVCSKILWARVSNAALRSSRTNTEINQLSAAISRSFITFTSAISALWWILKPDWNLPNKLK